MERPASPFDLLDASAAAFVDRVTASARDYLGAYVSFLAEIVGQEKVIRGADGPAAAVGVPVGARFPVADTYCRRLLDGVIPEAIYDVRADPLARDIPLTRVLGIESYMGVPVAMPDGRVVGTLCCINFAAEPERRTRDVAFMRFLADLLGRQLEDAVRGHDFRRERQGMVSAVLDAGGPSMVFQPIVALASGRTVGVEALARFDAPSVQAAPDVWFRQAWTAGLGPALELAAIQRALAALPELPADVFLSVNASPATLMAHELAAAIAGVPPGRLVVELTEHAAVEDYRPLGEAAAALRGAGVRIAIDDVGAGYASLRHVLEMAPDIAKLDMSLTRLIDVDPAKQAMAAGVMAFAARTRVRVVAEGVETRAEADALQAAGVEYAQGYLFARPGRLPDVLAAR